MLFGLKEKVIFWLVKEFLGFFLVHLLNEVNVRNFLLGKGNTLEGFAAAAAHAVAADTGDGGDRQERGATCFLVGKAEVFALLGAAAPLLLAHELESNHFAWWCGSVVIRFVDREL